MLLAPSSSPEPCCAGHVPAQPALQLLIESHQQFLRFLTRRVDSALAEDILQTAYLRAFEHQQTLATHESSTAWFYRVLRNAVIDHFRHAAVEDRALAEWARELEATPSAPRTDPLLEDTVCQCIASVLPSLKPAYAQILQAVDLDEGGLTAYAGQHALTRTNATVRLHRARKALRERLLACCGPCVDQFCLHCNCRL